MVVTNLASTLGIVTDGSMYDDDKMDMMAHIVHEMNMKLDQTPITK